MIKNVLLVCFCLVAAVTVKAQSVFSGRVLEDKTRITLHSVKIENLTSKLKTISLNDGSFSIAAKVGDILVFNAFSYQPDTLLITDMHAREIFLISKTTMLNQVNITDTSGRSKANPNAVQHYDPMFHGQAVVYQRDADFRPVGGIAIRLHYWSKDEKKRRKAAQSAKDREISERISAIFTPLNIANYVPLKGVDMDHFLMLYTPDVKEYTDKKFQLAPYLSACYENWQTLTPEQKKAGEIFGN
ncbi:hypothetical protein KXD93_10480 [Mucilaginibacter sp. BJC16-A38]|uniref:hypothetical protein n=1 Tax=Mucilaginibacter phenanthrenivorans TaxID=1234842 RepID=UPI00215711C2|nr:hypothetical protein [Mucilaginibacter phenanthrenivorans]MCR8558072.1 hypothetical protein [Mucilaginibacter phenanthrenivorans]